MRNGLLFAIQFKLMVVGQLFLLAVGCHDDAWKCLDVLRVVLVKY